MKDKNTAGVLALFLGGIGVHRFYLGQTGIGIAYLVFFWTFIPAIIAVIDAIIFWTIDKDKFDKKYNQGKLNKQKDSLMDDLQHAHDSRNFAEVIHLMENRELTEANLCYVYANALMSSGQTEKGKSVFKKAFYLGDKNMTRKVYGLSLYNNGHYEDAIEILQEIEKEWLADEFKFDDGYDIVETLASAFIELNKHKLAIETLKGAPLGKKNITDGLNKIFILLAECYEHEGDVKNAIKFYNKSLAYKYDGDIEQRAGKLVDA